VLQSHAFSYDRAIDRDVNTFQHAIEIGSDIRIPEPHHAISIILQPNLSFAIAPGGGILVVVSAIELDHEPLGRKKKVDDVRANRRLSPEMRAFDRKLLESPPKQPLMRRHVGPQPLCGGASD
jgi:hypothetical protein